MGCYWALEPQHGTRTQEPPPALPPIHVGPPKGSQGSRLSTGGVEPPGARPPSPTWRGRGEMRGPGTGWGWPRVLRVADRPPFLPPSHLSLPPSSPSTWSTAPGVCTQSSWKMLLLWKGFRGHCQYPSRRARPPRLLFLRQPRRPPDRGAPARAGARPGVPGGPARARGRWEPRPGPSLPLPARGAARAYLCGPGRSRGRHPVV